MAVNLACLMFGCRMMEFFHPYQPPQFLDIHSHVSGVVRPKYELTDTTIALPDTPSVMPNKSLSSLLVPLKDTRNSPRVRMKCGSPDAASLVRIPWDSSVGMIAKIDISFLITWSEPTICGRSVAISRADGSETFSCTL